MRYFFRPQFLRYAKIANFCKGKIILDFGSAEGELHTFMKRKLKGKIIGIDLKDAEIIHDLNRFPYPFKENYADTIVAGEIIEHLLKPYEFLKECYRILKPKGRLIITTPNMIGFQHIVKPNNFWVKNREDPHIYAWNIEMIAKLVEIVGFRIIHRELLNTFWARNLIYRGICYLFKKIRPTILVVAEKGK